jgi:hypothetical protein
LVVIVPRIVPLEYISTTLGLHKSVRALAPICTVVLRFCPQLEHTGTTITQTLSGLWLDSEKKEKTGSIAAPSEGGGSSLQWLLNGFLLVNVLQLVAIWGLGYLNEMKQSAQKEPAVQNNEEDEERRGAPDPASGIDELVLSPDISSQGSSDQAPVGDHTASPLLHPRSTSPVYRSYGTRLRPQPSLRDANLMGAATPAEARRGKVFASLCAATVVFAWGFFLTTSFVKIRSRREREGDL